MINANFSASSALGKVNAKVELYKGSTLVTTCTCNDRLQNFTVERIGQSNKFFGFGVIHKITIYFIDLERTLEIDKDTSFKAYFGYSEFINPFPTFYTAEISRDETTNTITVVAYDGLHNATTHTTDEVEEPYTVEEFAAAAATLLKLNTVKFIGLSENFFDRYHTGRGNFEGTESYKDALDAVAEVTQSIYYVDNEDKLVFKRLDVEGDPVATIDKDVYYNFDSGEKYKLVEIASVTELGDNVSASSGEEGVTQYVRDNPFWELRDDMDVLLNNALYDVGGIEIQEFLCEWDGNFLLEVGDKIALVTEDNNTIVSYVLNDVVNYDGLLTETTQWAYEAEEETATNPTSLGDKLKQTYAKVDKVNKEITLLIQDAQENSENIAALKVTTDSITSTVTNTQTKINGLENNYSELVQEVQQKVTAADVSIIVTEQLRSTDVESVTTSTGFTFNSEGLTITKSDSEISTNIDEDGLSVYKNDEEVLTADNTGVKAKNLHATTYLIIGENTYFADFTDNNGKPRAGCYWTGK